MQEDISNYIKTLDDYSLISTDTPLISNLNMLENIALIKEVHQHKSIVSAEKEAKDYLSKINLEKISNNRVIQCSNLEIFYVKLIRALMTDEDNIIIVLPFSITTNLTDVKSFIDNIYMLNYKKILILELYTNKSKYEGSLCNIIK